MATRVLGGSTMSHLQQRLTLTNVSDSSVSCTHAPPSKYLASFLGSVGEFAYSRGVRQALRDAYGAGDGDVDGVFVYEGRLPVDEYNEIMRSSSFCLCPPGWAPWTQRFMDAIAAGCIPVLFRTTEPSFMMRLPFSDVVPWHAFTVVIPPERAARVGTLLAAIPASERCRMRRVLAAWGPLMLWSSHTDATLALTLQQLQRRVRAGLRAEI